MIRTTAKPTTRRSPAVKPRNDAKKSAHASAKQLAAEVEASRMACRDAVEEAEEALCRAMTAAAAHLAKLAHTRREFEADPAAVGKVQPDGGLIVDGVLFGVAEPSSVMASVVIRVSLVTLGHSHLITQWTRRWGGLGALRRSGWLAGLPDVTAASVYPPPQPNDRTNTWPAPSTSAGADLMPASRAEEASSEASWPEDDAG